MPPFSEAYIASTMAARVLSRQVVRDQMVRRRNFLMFTSKFGKLKEHQRPLSSFGGCNPQYSTSSTYCQISRRPEVLMCTFGVHSKPS